MLDWDDKIPEECRQKWISNFEMIQEISEIRIHSVLVPDDAINLDIETIDTADARPRMCRNLGAI